MKKNNLYSGEELKLEELPLQEIAVDLSATISDAADILKQMLKDWSPIII